MARVPFDADDVERVRGYFAVTQPEEELLVRSLLERGAWVVEAWGPVQMAVWHLVIQRGNWLVILHSERGFGDWASIAPVASPSSYWDCSRPIGLAIFAWARASGVRFRLDTPDDFNHDLADYGCDALDWLDKGGVTNLERAYEVWIEHRYHLSSLRARGSSDQRAVVIAALEEAVK